MLGIDAALISDSFKGHATAYPCWLVPSAAEATRQKASLLAGHRQPVNHEKVSRSGNKLARAPSMQRTVRRIASVATL